MFITEYSFRKAAVWLWKQLLLHVPRVASRAVNAGLMDDGCLLSCWKTWSNAGSLQSLLTPALPLHTPMLEMTLRFVSCSCRQRIYTNMVKTHILYLNNLLIWHPCHKEVLFVLVGVEFDTVWDLPVGEVWDAFACGDKKKPSGTAGLHRKYWLARSSLNGGSHLSPSPRVWDSGRRQHWGTGNQCCWSKYLALLCCGLNTTKDRINKYECFTAAPSTSFHWTTSEVVRSGNGKYKMLRKRVSAGYEVGENKLRMAKSVFSAMLHLLSLILISLYSGSLSSAVGKRSQKAQRMQMQPSLKLAFMKTTLFSKR